MSQDIKEICIPYDVIGKQKRIEYRHKKRKKLLEYKKF